MNCDECGIEIVDNEYVETITGQNLCYGCDSKRLAREQ